MLLEEKHFEERTQLTSEQVAKIEKYTPLCFKNVMWNPLVQGSYQALIRSLVGTLKGIEKVLSSHSC